MALVWSLRGAAGTLRPLCRVSASCSVSNIWPSFAGSPQQQQRFLFLKPQEKKLPMALMDGLKKVKEDACRNFEESIDIAVRLNIDVRKQDQTVKGLAVLPKGTGKEIRVIVFAQGPAADEAKAAGATEVGGEELIEKIKGGFLDFDRCVATPDMMKSISKIARVLGPRGMMPNPKMGTVTTDVAAIVQHLRGGVTFKADKAGIVHALVGKVGFAPEDVFQNVEALVKQLHVLKPKGVKEPFFRSAFISSTMGKSVKLDIPELSALSKGQAASATASTTSSTVQPDKKMWVDRSLLDWDSVDPNTVASRKLRKYLIARRELKEKKEGTSAAAESA